MMECVNYNPSNAVTGPAGDNTILEMELNLSKTPILCEEYNRDIKIFKVSGAPMECTLECDYKIITVDGEGHRLFIVGICNTIIISGTKHSIAFEGFTNEVKFESNPGAEITIIGNQYTHRVTSSTGVIRDNGPIKPVKQDFPLKLSNSRRHRLAWRPVIQFGINSNLVMCTQNQVQQSLVPCFSPISY